MTGLVHKGHCNQSDKHIFQNDTIDNCNFLSNILNDPKNQSTPLVSRVPKLIVTNEINQIPIKTKPKDVPKSQTITKSTMLSTVRPVKKNHSSRLKNLNKPIQTKTIKSIKQPLIKSNEALNKKSITVNPSLLKSKSVQNITEANNDLSAKKNSFPNLNEIKKNEQNFDAIKVLEFLIHKAKQSNDSKNVTFDNLFNELNSMNNKAKNKITLENSLDIKLDQMETEMEILRTQLNRNSQKNHLFFKNPQFKNEKTSNLYQTNDNQIEKLQNELKESKKKCQVLEYLLDQKNKQTESFSYLFKEINDNLITILEEFGGKEMKYPAQTNFFNPNDTNSLKENLLKFQTKLKHHFKTANAYKYPNEKSMNEINHNKDTINTTSSDTLIDADSSFQSLSFSALVNQKNFYSNDDTKTTTSDDYIFKKPMYYQHRAFEYSDEDEDERIFLSMDDLSITTIQTSALEETESIDINKHDDEFSSDLQTLDQKIFQVKKLLQSMKSC